MILATSPGRDVAEVPAPDWAGRALRAVLSASPGRPADLSRRFARASTPRVREMLETLAALGQARLDPDGRYHG